MANPADKEEMNGTNGERVTIGGAIIVRKRITEWAEASLDVSLKNAEKWRGVPL